MDEKVAAHLAERKAALQAELEKALQQIQQHQAAVNEMNALAQRITGALTMIDELVNRPVDPV
jgi:hypothetical protein